MAQAGKFGCPECYSSFKEEILPLIKNVQRGESEHKGKIPSNTITTKEKIGMLTEQMDKAAKEEDYERAAQCRDAIRELETKEEVERS